MKKHKILKMVIVILALLLAYGCFVIFYFLNKEVSEKFCENYKWISGIWDECGRSSPGSERTVQRLSV